MAGIKSHFKVQTAPVAREAAVVHFGKARFTVLFDRLLRLEYDRDKRFEDRPSLAVWHRDQPVPEFEVAREGQRLTVATAALKLTYLDSPRGFAPETLRIELKQTGAIWRFGDRDPVNLGGTVRTVDGKDGPVPLSEGLVSRSGWSLLDDSGMPVLGRDSWVEARSGEALDLYFLGYASDYRQCLRDFFAISGRPPLVPRWVLGNWWSRYWHYRQEELIELMSRFREERIPMSVCVIDMDWHLVDNDSGRRGWTGYTWNRDLFPQVEDFMHRLHDDFGVKATLNLHPHDGVWPHEEAYGRMARHMGVDPDSREGVPFAIADPHFADGYFRFLHHPHEDIGVDFWWMDWQQGHETPIPRLDPLWWLNHLHYLDSGRDGAKRPIGFSRWAGYGNQRYPIGFSGDAVVSWESLAFQPYMTATAANVGCTWWSHDIGGHFHGVEDPELLVRWLQFGVFSPITRLHCAKGELRDRHPWGKGVETLEAAREYLRLRHALIPYLYSEARRLAQVGDSLCRPMYHDYPGEEAAYWSVQQYLFGSQLLVAPLVESRDRHTGMSRQAVWLPDGVWHDFFTGEKLAGGGWRAVYGELEEMPVFARAGAIVPMATRAEEGAAARPGAMELRIFAGADNAYELYEDDGETVACRDGDFQVTRISQVWRGSATTITIEPQPGRPGQSVPAQRLWTVVVTGIVEPEAVSAMGLGNGRILKTAMAYDAATESLRLELPAMANDCACKIELRRQTGLAAGRDRSLEKCEKWLYRFRLAESLKERMLGLLREGGAVREIAAFGAFAAPTSIVVCLAETLGGIGMHAVECVADEPFILIWNRGCDDRFHFKYCRRDAGRVIEEPVPEFAAISLRSRGSACEIARLPSRAPWALGLYCDDVLLARLAGDHGALDEARHRLLQ